MTPKELGRVGDPDFVLEGHASDLAEVRRLVTGDNLAECLVEELCGIVLLVAHVCINFMQNLLTVASGATVTWWSARALILHAATILGLLPPLAQLGQCDFAKTVDCLDEPNVFLK